MTIAMLRDRWWPQMAKKEVGCVRGCCVMYGRNEMIAQKAEISFRNRDGAPSHRGWLFSGQMTKVRNE